MKGNGHSSSLLMLETLAGEHKLQLALHANLVGSRLPDADEKDEGT
jgi:hypothetical protein